MNLAPRPMRLGDLSGPAHPSGPKKRQSGERDASISNDSSAHRSSPAVETAIRKEDAALYPGSYWSNVTDSPNWPSPSLDGICQRTSADIVPSADAVSYGQRTICQAVSSTFLARPGRSAPRWTASSRPTRNAHCMRTACPVKDISESGREACDSSDRRLLGAPLSADATSYGRRLACQAVFRRLFPAARLGPDGCVPSGGAAIIWLCRALSSRID
jgi:hypothetical protein